MFVFKAETFLEELTQYNPQMASLSIEAFEKAVVDTDFIRLNSEAFSQIKGDSIDYAVMEKTSKGKVVKLNAGWDDVGSWSALYDISKKDGNMNVINGGVVKENVSADEANELKAKFEEAGATIELK